jgi:hypothetical protein
MSSRLRLVASGVVVTGLLAGAAGPVPDVLSAARKGGNGPRGADRIEVARLRADLSFIAADELEGRATPSRGLDIAARYLAARLQALGLKPAGDDGTFFQTFGTTRRSVDPSKATLSLGDRAFSYGDDFLATAPGTAEGAMVYVGHGYVVRKKQIDAYAGVDVKGRIIVAHSGYPQGVTRTDTRGESGPETWESPATYAARHGALGVVLVPDYPTLAGWRTSRESATSVRGALTVDAFQAGRPRRCRSSPRRCRWWRRSSAASRSARATSPRRRRSTRRSRPSSSARRSGSGSTSAAGSRRRRPRTSSPSTRAATRR